MYISYICLLSYCKRGANSSPKTNFSSMLWSLTTLILSGIILYFLPLFIGIFNLCLSSGKFPLFYPPFRTLPFKQTNLYSTLHLPLVTSLFSLSWAESQNGVSSYCLLFHTLPSLLSSLPPTHGHHLSMEMTFTRITEDFDVAGSISTMILIVNAKHKVGNSVKKESHRLTILLNLKHIMLTHLSIFSCRANNKNFSFNLVSLIRVCVCLCVCKNIPVCLSNMISSFNLIFKKTAFFGADALPVYSMLL